MSFPQINFDPLGSLLGQVKTNFFHVLYEKRIAAPGDTLQFHTLSGVLRATQSQGWVQLDFPARKLIPCSENEIVSAALQLVPEECYQSGENLLYVLEDESAVRHLVPDFGALARAPFHAADHRARAVGAPGGSAKHRSVPEQDRPDE